MEITLIILLIAGAVLIIVTTGFLLYKKGQFDQTKLRIAELKLENEQLIEKYQAQSSLIFEFDKKNELLKQKQQHFELEQQEWEKRKSLYLNQITQEIISKNREEQDKFGQNQHMVIKKTTEDLLKNFEHVLHKVTSLNDDVKKTTDEINLTKKALLSPGSAGYSAEITLTNILKNSGLKEKINVNDDGDFILQSHFQDTEQNRKRPDAMVFLPNQILIIDSKSSPHFLELQKALEDENHNLVKEISLKIKEAMKRHLEDLRKKDYATAKYDELNMQDDKNNDQTPIITTIMFVQTEKILDIIRQIDRKFEDKANEFGIHILSPIGLINLLTQAKFLIHKIRQEKNIGKLKIEIKKLMDSLTIIFNKSAALGQAINKTAKTYNDFTGTFNRRLLPRIKNINELGVESDEKIIHNQLPKIHNESDVDSIEVITDKSESSN